jgi:hypothetical protein
MTYRIAFQIYFSIATRDVAESRAGCKMNGTHQLLVYAGDVNLLAHNINTAHENTYALTEARNVAGTQEHVRVLPAECGKNNVPNINIRSL